MRNKYILMRHGETKYQAKGIDFLYSQKEQFSLPITNPEYGLKSKFGFANSGVRIVSISHSFSNIRSKYATSKILSLSKGITHLFVANSTAIFLFR